MRKLLPVFDEVPELSYLDPVRNMAGPTLPTLPDKELKEKLQAFELSGEPLPPLVCCTGRPGWILTIDIPGVVNAEENIHNWFIARICRLSTVAVRTVNITDDQYVAFMNEYKKRSTPKKPQVWLDDNQLEQAERLQEATEQEVQAAREAALTGLHAVATGQVPATFYNTIPTTQHYWVENTSPPTPPRGGRR